MSYCRKGPDSDVYLYRGIGPDGPEYVVLPRDDEAPEGVTVLVCHECSLLDVGGAEVESHVTDGVAAMLAHLERHAEKGHRVPASAVTRLRCEL
jgi:hypothetical protein